MPETVNSNNQDSVSSSTAYSTNLANIKQFSNYKLDSHYLQFIMWLFISIFLVLLSFHTFTADEQPLISQIVIGVASILVLYQLGLYIKNKYF